MADGAARRARSPSPIGGLIGLFQGWLIAYLGIPSFIVTLGGLLVWRGAAWWVTTGQTIAPMDTRFKAFGGGVEGALGATATWVIAAIACGGIIVALGPRPPPPPAFRLPGASRAGPMRSSPAFACGAVLGAAAIANAYPLPAGTARRWAEANGIAWPEGGLFIPHGVGAAGADRGRGRLWR